MEASQSFASQLKHPWSDEDGFDLDGLGEATSGIHETDLQLGDAELDLLLRGPTFNLVCFYLLSLSLTTVNTTGSSLISFVKMLLACWRDLEIARPLE
jgi:hypothetical protein